MELKRRVKRLQSLLTPSPVIEYDVRSMLMAKLSAIRQRFEQAGELPTVDAAMVKARLDELVRGRLH